MKKKLIPGRGAGRGSESREDRHLRETARTSGWLESLRTEFGDRYAWRGSVYILS